MILYAYTNNYNVFLGIAFCIISYYDSIQISITVDKALMSSDEEVKVIFDGIMEELSSYESDLV
jgi:hypothetical protein